MLTRISQLRRGGTQKEPRTCNCNSTDCSHLLSHHADADAHPRRRSRRRELGQVEFGDDLVVE